MNTTPRAPRADCAETSADSARRAVETLYAGDLAAQALGIEILEVHPGRVRLAMTVRQDMLNGHRTCHGGIMFALADTAFAFACNSHGQAMVAAGASRDTTSSSSPGRRPRGIPPCGTWSRDGPPSSHAHGPGQ